MKLGWIAVALLAFTLAGAADAQAQSAWGGGCNYEYANDICIYINGNVDLDTAFVVYSFSETDPLGWARVDICVDGVSCETVATGVPTYYMGGYGNWYRDLPVVTGSAYTTLFLQDQYNQGYGYRISPTQYWEGL